MLRPAVRVVQLGVALPLTALLAWLGLWWWLPVPLAGSFLLYEWFFWSRGDRPVVLTLDADRVEVVDPLLDRRATVDLARAHAANCLYRRAEPGFVDGFVVLYDHAGPFFALQVHLSEGAFTPAPEDVDLDACNAVLGSISGVRRALAPPEATVRQVVRSDEVLPWLRRAIPAAAWRRTAFRFWRGAEPELDLFGYHVGPADGACFVDGDRVTFTDLPGEARALQAVEPQVAERRAVMFRVEGGTAREAPERVPLWVQPVGGRAVAIPAPLAADLARAATPSDAWLHTHPPEGAALLWHLWRAIPVDRWPAAWREAVRGARAHLPAWPHGLPDPDRPGSVCYRASLSDTHP